MKEIKAPGAIGNADILFLAGSIEMGAAENWQITVTKMLDKTNWTIANPRRDDWDSSWEQSLENKQFVEQVEWELKGIERADRVLMYFDPKTKSPITLLELGLIAGRCPMKLIVVCPEGFWRKGNVDVVCRRYKVKQCGDLESAVRLLTYHEQTTEKSSIIPRTVAPQLIFDFAQ